MTYPLSGVAQKSTMWWAASVALLLLATQGAQGVTVAHWDFEDGVDGQPFTDSDGGAENGSGGSVDTVTGALMRGWSNAAGPSWTSATSNGVGLAMNNADNGQDGYLTEGALHNWAPTAWTIETTVYLEELAGWETLIGRDGASLEDPESDFYLSNNGIDDRFRINFETSTGERWILDGDYEVQTNTWYALAAVSDGATLSLWLDDGFDGDGYQQIGTLDISSQTAAQNVFPASELNWTFGRGWYDGGFVDHIDGKMDNIRFSDEALAPEELIALDVSTPLQLQVNTTTGEVRVKNESGEAIALDYYRIDSPTDGSLITADYDGSTGWDSLSDQGIDAVDDGLDPGETWDEVTASISANLLVEQFLLGETTLNPNGYVALGAPVDLGLSNDDLEFRVSVDGGALQRANVVYVTDFGGLDGDYNEDGVVNAADYTLWRDNVGQPEGTLPNDGSLSGVIGQDHYDLWRDNYGASSAPSAGAAVPEPGALLLAFVALAGMTAARRS